MKLITCLVFVTCLFTVHAFSCGPCVRKKCARAKCRTSSLVLDACGCCPVCAKLEGELCGGQWKLEGICDSGLACIQSEPRVVAGGLVEITQHSMDSEVGTCTRAYATCRDACLDTKFSILSPLGMSYSGKSAVIVSENIPAFWTYCDCSEGADKAWMVIQRRMSGIESFYQSWDKYRDGFGFSTNDFWMGLERMHEITSSNAHELAVVVQYEDSSVSYSTYGTFNVGDLASSYQLEVGENSGENSESFVKNHNGMKFSTHDQDNDEWSGDCAKWLSAGWWFNSCTEQNLNGVLYGVSHFPIPHDTGNNNGPDRVTWNSCRGKRVQAVEMKIRPI